jgi:hypothetical protein
MLKHWYFSVNETKTLYLGTGVVFTLLMQKSLIPVGDPLGDNWSLYFFQWIMGFRIHHPVPAFQDWAVTRTEPCL